MTDLSILDEIVLGSARGGAKRRLELRMEYVRDLNEADLPFLLNPPALGVEPPRIKTLAHSHHLAARLLAEGRKPGEVSLQTGYAPATISNLQRDPAFRELMEYYKEQADAAYIDAHQRLAALGLSAADELGRRLDEEPEAFKARELLDISTAFLDRTITKEAGVGRPAGPVAVNVTFVSPSARPQGPILDLEHEEIAK